MPVQASVTIRTPFNLCEFQDVTQGFVNGRSGILQADQGHIPPSSMGRLGEIVVVTLITIIASHVLRSL